METRPLLPSGDSERLLFHCLSGCGPWGENVQNRGSRWLIIEHTFFLNIHQIIPLILQDWIIVSVWHNIAVPLGLSHSLSQMRLSCRWHIVQKGKSSAMCGTFLLWCIVLLSFYQSVAKYILGLLYTDTISCSRLHHNLCTQGFIRLVSHCAIRSWNVA